MDKDVPGHQRKDRVEEVILQVKKNQKQTPVSPDVFGPLLISSLPNQQKSSYKGSLEINKWHSTFFLRACLHEGGGPRVGEVTCGKLSHLTCKRDNIKMRDYMERRDTPPKRVTSPTWSPPPPCKQALSFPSWQWRLILLHPGPAKENFS